MKKYKRGMLVILTILVMVLTSIFSDDSKETSAATSYIKIDAFIEYLINEANIPVDNTTEQPYIDTALKLGILKQDDFESYSSYLTRTDCAVLANRLDEYLNLKYGYSLGVYEILSDCNYFEGRLYYNTKGKLYPEGATKDTYPASQFLEEVLSPVLETEFKNDNWAEQSLRAGYKYLYDDDHNISERYIIIGVKPESEYNVVGIDPFDDNSYIIQAWKKINDGDRKLAEVLDKRISDINKVAKSKRNDVAAVVAKGIYQGSSNGMYIQNRSFKGSTKVTVTEAKSVVQKVLHPEKRASVSPDGNLIRKTNLPKNAADYAYILACFPNEYYEMRYNFMYYEDFKSGKTDKSLYAYPVETDYEFINNTFNKNYMSLSMDKYDYYDAAISQAEKYLNCVFNMNYKTVNDNWSEKIASSYARYRDERVENDITDYIAAVKKNHVVVESKTIAIDPGTLYYSNSCLYVRSYVKYRVTANSIDVDQDDLLCGYYNKLIGLKNGEWRYGYYDIKLNLCDDYEEGNSAYWGVDYFVKISDWAYRGTY